MITEAFALVGGPVYEDLGADDVAKGKEHLHEFRVAKFLGKVIDEEVAALRTGDGTAWEKSAKKEGSERVHNDKSSRICIFEKGFATS